MKSLEHREGFVTQMRTFKGQPYFSTNTKTLKTLHGETEYTTWISFCPVCTKVFEQVISGKYLHSPNRRCKQHHRPGVPVGDITTLFQVTVNTDKDGKNSISCDVSYENLKQKNKKIALSANVRAISESIMALELYDDVTKEKLMNNALYLKGIKTPNKDQRRSIRRSFENMVKNGVLEVDVETNIVRFSKHNQIL